MSRSLPLPLPFFTCETAVKEEYGPESSIRFFPKGQPVRTNGRLAEHLETTIRHLAHSDFIAIGIGVIKTQKNAFVDGKSTLIEVEKKFVLLGKPNAFHLLGVPALTSEHQEKILQL